MTPNVNAHLHTPYSFSAFEKLTDALDQAVDEQVKIVGINDFYTMDGYREWHDEAIKRKLYPLFNIELISLQAEDQAKSIRVNDPNNPGRTYLSGKGLKYPVSLPEPYASELANVRAASNGQVKQMCKKLNEVLHSVNAGFELDIEWIKKELTQGQIRERHLAKALRIKAYSYFNQETKSIAAFFNTLFGEKALKSNVEDFAGVENEIRGNLLKAGGAAFVPEETSAFLPLDRVQKIILAAGGIPTYPFLGDDANGIFTDFENNIEKAADILKQRGIHSVEFITTRNSIEVLENYAGYLFDNGFVVTFGSEHNTPASEPIELFARGKTPLTNYLRSINYEGACIIAAHQELVRNGQQGYVDISGQPNLSGRDDLSKKGDELIKKVING
ncbi:MAG: hypothetical protein LBV72_03350 [Tannerella sp.]|jgi:hypothetical protein|nr:hypothetical protein [Tannerella sp.]